MKAIGYFYEDNYSSVEEQRESFANYCRGNDHQPITEFIDKHISEDPRSGYNALVKYLTSSESEFLLLVWGTYQLAETLELQIDRILELDELGTKIICTRGELPDPLQQALRTWNTNGSKGNRGQQIKQAMMAKAMRGEGLGKPPFGYIIGEDGRLILNTEESPTVTLIFKLYTQNGLGMRRIVNHLNQLGSPTRTGKGWSIVTVRDILRNRSYIGTYSRFGTLVPRNHTAIIDANTFNITQEILARANNKKVVRKNEPFMLSRLLNCAYCGNSMIGVNRRQSWIRKDGSKIIGKYRYYQCHSRANKGMCEYHTWKSEMLEGKIKNQIKDYLAIGQAKINVLGSYLTIDDKWNLTGENPDPSFLRTLESAASGLMSLDQLRTAVRQSRQSKENQKTEPLTNGLLMNAIKNDDVSTLLKKWDDLDSTSFTLLLKGLIDRVNVNDDYIEIILQDKEVK